MKKLIKNVVVLALLLLGNFAIAGQKENEVVDLLKNEEMKEQVFRTILNTPDLKKEMLERLEVKSGDNSCCAMMGSMEMNHSKMEGMMDPAKEDGEMCKMCKMMMGNGKMGMMKNMKHSDMGMMNMEDSAPAGLQGEPKFLVEYNDLKNALVQDNVMKAKEAASQMIESLSTSRVEKEQRNQLVQNLQKISSSEDIKVQRQQFSQLSDRLYQIVKKNDLTKNPLYLQHCSMAMGGKGANWLSYEKQVQNPYMGQRMPGCGSVKEVVE